MLGVVVSQIWNRCKRLSVFRAATCSKGPGSAPEPLRRHLSVGLEAVPVKWYSCDADHLVAFRSVLGRLATKKPRQSKPGSHAPVTGYASDFLTSGQERHLGA
jgi:hypothetical protein